MRPSLCGPLYIYVKDEMMDVGDGYLTLWLHTLKGIIKISCLLASGSLTQSRPFLALDSDVTKILSGKLAYITVY